MARKRSETRNWLLFAGIIVLVLALGCLPAKIYMLKGKMLMPLLILAAVLILLAKLKRTDKEGKE